jgi:hypothetical protein
MVSEVEYKLDATFQLLTEQLTATGALVIFIVDGRWASFTIADSLVVIGEFS